MTQTSAASGGTVLLLEKVAEISENLSRHLRIFLPDADVLQATSLQQARSLLAARQSIALAVIDLRFPDGNAVALIRELRSRQPDCLIAVTTLYLDDEQLIPALAAGAQAYLLKDDMPRRLHNALSELFRGVPALSPGIAHRLLRTFDRLASAAQPSLDATTRNVLVLASRGYSLDEIADRLDVAPAVIVDCLKQCYRHLHALASTDRSIA